MSNLENQKIEIDLLLRAIYLKYGYDFRSYARASVRRRILHRLALSGFDSISHMLHEVLRDKAVFETLLMDLSINVTEMFRDPSFYKAFRRRVIPLLKDRSYIKIWHAGCSSGQEVYSMAILLKEEGLYENARIYATDFNEEVLLKAKEAIYPIDRLKDYTRNYKAAGGLESFADYYTARYDYVIMDRSLKKNILFSDHNLVTDGVFGEMDVIVCRNVLIYFNRELQNRVLTLFLDSLGERGFLCL
ncbi:MAG: protein-glutamate O-methyltransferase CheR, partial [Desulfobacterales bacterium]|nr:protein-glutamate O-methyltransferase CheR [Desulfobacterales bacterium]